jgi:ferrochelatase
MKVAVVLFNLGGPDGPEAVRPFLSNLFCDPAIITLPAVLRLPLGHFIAWRRAPVARQIYEKIGGRSPIVAETAAQAEGLETLLKARGLEAKVVMAMRYWKPFAVEAAAQIKAFGPDEIVLLPLYPQYSTTTSASSLRDFEDAARRAGLAAPLHRVCCFPDQKGFIAAEIRLLQAALAQRRSGLSYRVLFSAHGLPKRIVSKGDPYPEQVNKTVQAIVTGLGEDIDHVVCYQSRVGRLEWIGPATDAEIARAGRDGKGVVIVPVAFVSEHSETLVELDIEYGHLAKASGVADYIRVPTVGTAPEFLEGLSELVEVALRGGEVVSSGPGRICPQACAGCGYGLNRGTGT